MIAPCNAGRPERRWTKHLLFGGLIFLLAVQPPATGFAAKRTPQESWGKAGISFDQYRRDAIACGREGYFLDISETDDAKAFVRGSRELDDATRNGTAGSAGPDPVEAAAQTARDYERVRLSVQPDQRMDHIKTAMLSTVSKCLTDRGYSRFRLRDQQRRRLAKLPIGSLQRQSYLYSLASDGTVLKSQAL